MHIAGTVAASGTILVTLLPEREELVAEVWFSNEDVGFGHRDKRRTSSSRRSGSRSVAFSSARLCT
jgi:hypothetical protein